MKIEKLNENKIKITLSSEDLQARNIDVQSFIYNTPESQDLFWDVMQEAEKKYGFNVDESMVYVEASATASGIFTLTVTKTSNSLNKTTTKSRFKKTNYRLKRKSVNTPLDNSIYKFNTFDDICDFCNSSHIADFSDNDLYEFNSNYYLLVSNVPNSNILEYATREHNTNFLFAKLSEYGKKIIEKDALNIISNNFVRSKKSKLKSKKF